MNRWLLTVAGIAAAGSAIAATTNKPAAPKAQAPRQTVTVRPAKARPTTTFVPSATRPATTPAVEPALAPTTVEAAPAARAPEPVPTTLEVVPATTPAADPAPSTPSVEAAPATVPAADPVIVEERDVVIRREPNQEGGLSEDVVVEVDSKTGKILSKSYTSNRFVNTGASFLGYGWTGRIPESFQKNISLNVDDASPKEALEAVLKQVGGGVNLIFDKDAPNDTRISLKVKQVSAASLVALIAQNAGLDWNINLSGDKRVNELRVSKASAKSRLTSTYLQNLNRTIPPGHQMVDVFLAPSVTSEYATARRSVIGEQRLSLECPHCKAKSTIIRQRSQPKCPKCTRTFQSDWQFCPADGSKRPADPNEWKFCPNCGKKVDVEKASIEGGIPFLSDLPIVGEVFRLPSAQNAAPVPLTELPSPYVVPLPRLPGASPSYPKGHPTPTPGIPGKPGAFRAYPKGPLTPVPGFPAKPGATPEYPKVPLTPVSALPAKPVLPPAPAAPPATPAPVPTAPVPSPDPAPEPAATPAK